MVLLPGIHPSSSERNHLISRLPASTMEALILLFLLGITALVSFIVANLLVVVLIENIRVDTNQRELPRRQRGARRRLNY